MRGLCGSSPPAFQRLSEAEDTSTNTSELPGAAVAMCAQGTDEEVIRSAFLVFDFGGVGSTSYDEFAILVLVAARVLTKVCKENAGKTHMVLNPDTDRWLISFFVKILRGFGIPVFLVAESLLFSSVLFPES